MDISGKDTNVAPQQKSNEPVNYHSPNIHSDWRVNENPTNTSVEMVEMGSTVMEPSTCSSALVVDSVGPHIWDHQFNAQALGGYCDMNVQYNAGTSSSLGPVRAETGWHQGAVLKGGMFQPSFPTMLPQSLPHLPSDSAFIERAARYSCFGGGSFGQMMNPFILSNPPLNHCDVMRGSHEFLGGNSVKPLPGMPDQGCGMHVTEISKDGLFRGKCEAEEGSPLKKSGSFVASLDEAKYPIGVSGNESDEAEFSGHGTQEELGSPPGESSLKGIGSKKRKRGGQDNGLDDNYETPQLSVETANENEEIKQKGDQNPIKTGGKHTKQGSQGSDPTKEGYVHIRARRGQATNSHSLAERVRREKISERMKFLQDLVPGCSKVTGKAVMLDEIINYVQSLQRQVEFLSMKLATVNPRLDFNIEGFVTKDMLQPRPGMPSSLVFPPDMTTIPFPPLHPSQHGAVQTALPAPDVWEDELHNIVHMGFN